jgi:hypothetical protein
MLLDPLLLQPNTSRAEPGATAHTCADRWLVLPLRCTVVAVHRISSPRLTDNTFRELK